MLGSVSIIEQFHERLQSLKSTVRGDVYGLVDGETGDVILLAATSSSCQPPLAHDPSLLLPSPLELVGSFTRQDEDEDQDNTPTTHHQDHTLMVRVVGKEVTMQQQDDSGWQDVEFSLVSQEEFEGDVLIARTRYCLDLSSRDKAADVKAAVASHSDRLSSSGSACFRREGLVLLGQEGSEGETVLTYGAGFTDSDQSIGDALDEQQLNKPGYKSLESLEFELMVDRSSSDSTEAPVLRITNEKVKVHNTLLQGESISYLHRSMPLESVGKVLLRGVLQHLRLAEYWLIKLLTDKKIRGNLETVNVLPYKSGHMFTILYPSDTMEDDLQDYRKSVNQNFLLPHNSPFMRRSNVYEFSSNKKSYHLYNTHVGLKPPAVSGIRGITQGLYSYHHYMQDKFNDNKWGCAYRSLQTIVSWFRHQGYTTKTVPTHREIQQCLVNIGDKQGKFVGSTEWIGSTEVGFVLESWLGVTSRFISVSSGDELSEKGRELVHHFNTQGTPIMIGGGVLAHTILGVTWNPDSGDISYLILDPHYTGGEDLATIQRQGWCGWKGPKFWSAKAYYNMCLPQRPSMV